MSDLPVPIPLYYRNRLATYALISPEDFEEVSKHEWLISKTGYAYSTKGELMHRFIARPEGDLVVDHINRNRLDNRRENLRNCTQAQNIRNTSRPNKKLRGITIDKRSIQPAVRAEITLSGRKMSLGTFPNEIEAARAYDSAARQLHGEFAYLNFPEEVHHPEIDWHEHIKAVKERGPANRKLSGEAIQEIQERAAAGESRKDLAAAYNVSKALIYFVLNGTRDSQKHEKPEWLDAALSRVQAGEPAHRVAEEMKVSLHVIRRHLKKMEKAPVIRKARTDRKISVEQAKEIIRRVQEGERQTDLAREHGVSLTCINSYVKGRVKIE